VVTCPICIEINNKGMVTWMVTCGNMYKTNNKSICMHQKGTSSVFTLVFEPF